ncbi:heme-binding domain-containing protein [Halpernia sp.]|uniref:heme-binding domain-containing protein n=1 Tax=Halpernia sp. TaxID=2782209 RepID=UPI003A8CD667
MKTFKTIVFWFLIGISLIQFIPIDRENKPVKKSENFVEVLNSPPKVQNLLKNACYDCHSNETKYPNYAFIAPLSWAVKNHVNDGREHLNFSEWATFNSDLKKNMLENSISDLEQYKMPMSAYIAYHPKANITKADRQILINYFEALLKSKEY